MILFTQSAKRLNIQEINIVHGIFLSWLVISEAAVSFWQTSPGSFARIQIGGGQQKQHQQQAQRAPSYLPQQQLFFVPPPPPQIASRFSLGARSSNHVAPFVHFSGAASDHHLRSKLIQTPLSANKEGNPREGKRVRDEANDAFKSNHDEVSVKKNKKNETARNDKQLIVENLKEVSGLGSTLKQHLRNKLEKLRSRQNQGKSIINVLLEKSKDQEFLQDKTDGRVSNFLKRLIEIVEEKEQFEEEFDDDNEKDYLVLKEDIVTNEIDEGMSFFKQAGLFPDDDIKQQQKTFPFSNFLDVEKEAVQDETEDLAQEISSLLSQLEGKF